MDGKTRAGDRDESVGWLRARKKEARGGWRVDQDVRTEMEEIDRGSEIELIDKEKRQVEREDR